MAPTSFHYSPLPLDEFSTKLPVRKLPVWVRRILLVLLVVVLTVAMVVFAAKANSPACKDGLRAEQKCRNITHLLEHELSQAQDVLRGTEAKAATCKQTVETLNISLEEEKAGRHKQQELVQKLQGEIKTLSQSLQEKSMELEQKSEELEKKSMELEQLRKQNDDLVSGKGTTNAKGSPNSGISLRLSVALVLLSLSLHVLLA